MTHKNNKSFLKPLPTSCEKEINYEYKLDHSIPTVSFSRIIITLSTRPTRISKRETKTGTYIRAPGITPSIAID